ncbi:MAG: class I SAM-dependent methyltransferase [Chitinophagaceae bacterium]|nr:MAG: class I SAM-dependent methyltransferase [Chitinophagaceae bacterium]
MNSKTHWEKIYNTKQLSEVSWYQPRPEVSLAFVNELKIAKDAAIIDVGGGDSYFVDQLLQMGYTDITVLDISESAISRAKERLGDAAKRVNWIVSDIKDLSVDKKFDFWHDRAAFHFLTTEEEVQQYLSVAEKHLSPSGKMVIGTFSTSGPEKCSGLPVKQYNEESLSGLLSRWFQKIKCISVDHTTPFNTIQNFLFCSFKKLSF